MPEEVSDILFGSSEPAPKRKSKSKKTTPKYVGGIETRLSDVKVELGTGMDDLLFGSSKPMTIGNFGSAGSIQSSHHHTTQSNKKLDVMMDDLVYGKQDTTIKYQKSEPKKKQPRYKGSNKQVDKKMNDLVYGKKIIRQEPKAEVPVYTYKKQKRVNTKGLDRIMDDVVYGSQMMSSKKKQYTGVNKHQSDRNNAAYTPLSKLAHW
jgi:hypothetical protein